MKRTNIYLTEHQMDALKRLHEATGLKPAELVRRAVDEYLEKQQEKLLRNQQQQK